MKQRTDRRAKAGFTLMEIVVSTTIFAFVSVAMMTMFNYTLKINRRSEALRQATQGMRNFVEYLVKEIRNGEIDYAIVDGNEITTSWPVNYCGFATPPITKTGDSFSSLYPARSNKLAFINNDGERKCIFYGGKNGVDTSPQDPGVFSATNGAMVQELADGGSRTTLNPPNFSVDSLMFVVRPVCDPLAKCTSYGNSYPKIQPNVQIMVRFTTLLATGEKVTINYQTSVSINKYNYPNQN
jgi:type II secretory pathway pseudopilin PulG